MKDNKPNTRAAALKYDGENTPKIVAKGAGDLADKIIATAKQHNIHIHEDPLLLAVLSRLELGEEIPKPLYLAVAKIIAFAYFLQGKHPEYKQDKYSEKQEISTNLTYSTTEIKDTNINKD